MGVPDSGPLPCPAGAEGCACAAGSCAPGLDCLRWAAAAGAPFNETCARRCVLSSDCASSAVGRACLAYEAQRELVTICARRSARPGEACSASRLTTPEVVGCAAQETCLTHMASETQGQCRQLCEVTIADPTGGCPFPAEVCSPEAAGNVASSPVASGACIPAGPRAGQRCSAVDPARYCDLRLGLLSCVTLPNQDPSEGFCIELCRLADGRCAAYDPGLGPFRCVDAAGDREYGVCSADCSRFPDTCASPGIGLGSTCSGHYSIDARPNTFNLCLDVQRPVLRESFLQDGPGGVVVIPGDACAGFAGEPYRCPDGTFCDVDRGNGLCLRGCTTATSAPYFAGGCHDNNASAARAICAPQPGAVGDDQLCVLP